MRWSIRYQLLVPLLILLLGIVAGISVWTALAAANHTHRDIETRMRHVAQTIDEGGFPLTENVLQMTKGLSGADYLVIKANERPITSFTTGDGIPAAQMEIGEPQRVRLGAVVEFRLPSADSVTDEPRGVRLGPQVDIAGRVYFCSGVRVRQHRASEAAILYILYPESLWRDALWEAILPSLTLGAVGGLASLVLALGLAQRYSRRIQELERRTRLIAAGDFSPMPLPGRNDELRDLGQSVNDMAAQLAQLQDAIKKTESMRLLGQVSGGLAHQLRNGVAGARLAVQLHASECQADHEALEVALRQLSLVEANLKRFLDLGRSDETRFESCSLTAQIGAAVALLAPQCRHAHVDLRWHPASEIHMQGDPSQLGHLFLNLIGNAVEAAGAHGWVEIIATETERPSSMCRGRCVVEILDSGPGPAPELAGRLFEPFVTGKREGVGLGLVVARRAAEAHGGGITWERRGDRTCFRIELAGGPAICQKTP